MCGIIYVKRKDGRPASKSVLKRYYKQRDRGTDGFGYVAIQDNKVVSYVRSPIEHEIVAALRKETATEILFHHRYPTSVPNVEEGAHPLFVSHEDAGKLQHQYFVVHNGVIRNDADLKKEHEKMGFKYRTEIFRKFVTVLGHEFDIESEWNDSEALAIETAMALDSKKDVIDAKGVAAVVALQLQDDEVVGRFAYRNGNPLNYYSNDVLTILSSEGGGKELDKILIQRISEDGTMDDDSRRIYTPNSYNPTAYQHSSAYSDPSDYDPDPSKSHNLSLPGGRHDFLMARGLDEFSSDEFPEVTVVVPEPIELLNISRTIKNFGERFIGMMTDDTLWKEFDRIIGAEEDFDHGMQVFEDRIVDMGGFDDPTLKSFRELEAAGERLKEYRASLEAEITKREAGALIPRSS